jgi:soluble lytic murein transglycosylase-like protein
MVAEKKILSAPFLQTLNGKFRKAMVGLMAIVVASGIYLSGKEDSQVNVSPNLLQPRGYTHANPGAYPQVLSKNEQETVRLALAYQEQSRYADADRKLRQLSSPSLRAYLLEKRFLKPSYRANAAQIREWCEANPSFITSRQVFYRLERQIRGLRGFCEFPADLARARIASEEINASIGASNWHLGNSRWGNRSVALKEWQRIHGMAKQDYISKAVHVLDGNHHRGLFTQEEYVIGATNLAYAYLQYGQPESALRLASSAVRRSDTPYSEALWVSGLSAWKLKRYQEALRYFAALSSQTNTPARKSAGHYWAYRAASQLGMDTLARQHLARAAVEPQSFYGILAQAGLSTHFPLVNDPVRLKQHHIQSLLKDDYISLAAALYQLEDNANASRLLEHAFVTAKTDKQREKILSFVSLYNLPALQLKLGRSMMHRSRSVDYALYPIPSWYPEGGYQIDPALLFSIARQESGFNEQVSSTAGAQGIMQLLPSTANAMKRLVAIKGDNRPISEWLRTPELSLALGQHYLLRLMESPIVSNNLVLALASYNAGPATVSQWTEEGSSQDPLLFIETIPYRETRKYVKRVLTGYWIYQYRLGQPLVSANALHNNVWPFYMHTPQSYASLSPSAIADPKLDAMLLAAN